MLLRKFSLIALIAMAIGGFTALTASDASAQASATQSANINALINNPIALTKNTDLDFGSAAPSTAATTVVIDPAGVQSGTAIGQAGATSAATFTVTGLAAQSYAITLPASASITDGTNTMTVDTFTENATNVLTGGTENFGVGATLNIGANQAAGAYAGTFDVTVAYN